MNRSLSSDRAPRAVRSDYLVFGRPSIGEEEMAEVADSLRSGWLGRGPKVDRFERDFAALRGAAHAVATHSCTAALQLSLRAAGIGAGDEVITTPLTFCATINAILNEGATPVLADVDRRTLTIDPAAVEAASTSRTRALLPVHFGGRPCALDALRSIARRREWVLIEDCSHAIEAEYRGRACGRWGDFGCFSFDATKTLTTGEGGMILTPDAEPAERLRRLALHGLAKDAWQRFDGSDLEPPRVVELGLKANLTDLQAAIGLHQIPRLEHALARRETIWRAYDEAFADLPVERPAAAEPDTRHARYLYTLLIGGDPALPRRAEVRAALHARNIGTGVHYPSVAEHPYYQSALGWRPEVCPHALEIGRRTLSLPLTAALGDRDVTDVIDAVRAVLR